MTARRLAAYAAGSLATLVLGPVLAVEVWYRSLLPPTLPQASSDSLPPLVRSALDLQTAAHVRAAPVAVKLDCQHI